MLERDLAALEYPCLSVCLSDSEIPFLKNPFRNWKKEEEEEEEEERAQCGRMTMYLILWVFSFYSYWHRRSGRQCHLAGEDVRGHAPGLHPPRLGTAQVRIDPP